MDDLLRSHVDIRKTGPLYRAFCLSCGHFIAASAQPSIIAIVERQHNCDAEHMEAGDRNQSRVLTHNRWDTTVHPKAKNGSTVMSSNPSPSTAFYRRTFRDNGLSLESTCLYCGTRIVCGLPESLKARESDHLARCAAIQTRPATTQQRKTA